MREYQTLIDEYSKNFYWMYTDIVPKDEWGDKKIAEAYLEKYWLPKIEYETVWRAKQDVIFVDRHQTLPNMLFKQKYNLIALRGGVLFEERDFKQLQDCVLSVGDSHIVVIENGSLNRTGCLPFCMKFPASISWHELLSGNFISSVLFEMFQNEYFVFGESATWGKYAANDYELPLDLIGFEPEYTPLFKRVFAVSEEEEAEIRTWLPPAYKDRVL